jgi:hypothetical protein
MPQNMAISSTSNSKPSLSGSIEVSPASLLEMTSEISVQPPLNWDLTSGGVFYDPESLQPNLHIADDILENGSVINIETTPVMEQYGPSEPLKWEHMSSTNLKPHEVIKNVKPLRKAGRRHGRLNPETAKGAQEMRNLRACLPCAILKIKVS